MLQKMKSNLTKVKNYFSRGPIAALAIVFTVFIILGITVYSVNNRKVITVSIDGKNTQIVSYDNTVKEALEHNKIELGPKDKVEPSVNTKVENGQKINIKRAVGLVIFLSGKKLKIKSAENSVGAVLKSEHIALNKFDRVKPSKNSSVKKDMKISITRVNIKSFTETQPIAFNTIIQKDDSIANDQNQVVQQGSEGTKEVKIQATYEDGKEVSRNEVSEVVKNAPVNAVVKQGTLGSLEVNRGSKILYKSKINVLATGYTSNFGFGITATGARTVRDTGGYSSVSVDPRVIPLGTKLYIPGYGYGIAEDTGGLIKGNRVDLFYNSESDCYKWGAKSVDVYILK